MHLDNFAVARRNAEGCADCVCMPRVLYDKRFADMHIFSAAQIDVVLLDRIWLKFKKMAKLFRSRNFNVKLDEIKNPISQKSNSSRLEKIGIWVSIISSVASFILAIIAINLTVKYGESKDQITELKNIASSQQTEINKLVEMVEGLKKQNDLAQEQNSELRSQGLIIAEELKIFQEQQRQNYTSTRLKRKSDFAQLASLLMKLSGTIGYSGKKVFKEEDKLGNPTVVDELGELMDEFSGNSYILENDTLYKKCRNLKGELLSQASHFRADYNPDLIPKVIDGKTTFVEDPAQAAVLAKEWNEKVTDNIYDFLFAIMDLLNSLRKTESIKARSKR